MWVYMLRHAKMQYCAIILLLFRTIFAATHVSKDLRTRIRAMDQGSSNIQLSLRPILSPRDPTNTPYQRMSKMKIRQGTSYNNHRIASPVSSPLSRQQINVQHRNSGQTGHSGDHFHGLAEGYESRTSTTATGKSKHGSASKLAGKSQALWGVPQNLGSNRRNVDSSTREMLRWKARKQEQKDRRATRERERRKIAKEQQNFAHRKWPNNGHGDQKENTAIQKKDSQGAATRKRAPTPQGATLDQTAKRVKKMHLGNSEQRYKVDHAEESSSGNRNPLHELTAGSSIARSKQRQLMSPSRLFTDGESRSGVSAKPHASRLLQPDSVSTSSKSVDLNAHEQLPSAESDISSGRHKKIRPAPPFIRLLPGHYKTPPRIKSSERMSERTPERTPEYSWDSPQPAKPPKRTPEYSWDSPRSAKPAARPFVRTEERPSSENTMQQMYRTSNMPSSVSAARSQGRISSENTMQQMYRSFRMSSPTSSLNTIQRIHHAMANDEL